MESQSPGAAAEYEFETSLVPWKSFESRTASAFTLGGMLLVASILVPVGLKPFTGLSWALGLVLVGLGVVAMAMGLIGTYPQVSNHAPWLARIGTLCATVASAAALGLIATVGTGVLALVTLGTAFPKPMGVFVALVVSMAVGLSLGFVLFGVARVRTNGRSDSTGGLLIGGGVLLLFPVLAELLRFGIGIGPPPWLLFLALGLLAIDTLVAGYSLRSESDPAQ